MDYDILIYIMCLFSVAAVISHCLQCYKLRHISNVVMTPVSISIVLTLSVFVLRYCVKPSLYYMYTGEEIKIPIIAYVYLLASLLIVYIQFSMSWQHISFDEYGNITFIGMNPFKIIITEYAQISLPKQKASGIWVINIFGVNFTTTVSYRHVYQYISKARENAKLSDCNESMDV